MKVTARRSAGSTHTVSARDHRLIADEPREKGGDDAGPNPEELLAASLAACTAITMEMYAQRKGWDLGPLEVDVAFEPAERGSPTAFALVLRVADDLSEEQVESLRAIAARCPIHRTLEGEVTFSERIERTERVAPAA